MAEMEAGAEAEMAGAQMQLCDQTHVFSAITQRTLLVVHQPAPPLLL